MRDLIADFDRSRIWMRRLAPVLVFLACALAAQGCELVADFDRSKIPGRDASIEAGATTDEDAGEEDAGAQDAGTDAASRDAGDDAGTDDGG